LKKWDRHLTTTVFRGNFDREFGASPLFPALTLTLSQRERGLLQTCADGGAVRAIHGFSQDVALVSLRRQYEISALIYEIVVVDSHVRGIHHAGSDNGRVWIARHKHNAAMREPALEEKP
jgi:hypothetical protein